MKKQIEIGLDFIIDKLTNSVENNITGDSFATEISLLKSTELKNITKKKKVGYLIGKMSLNNQKETFIN